MSSLSVAVSFSIVATKHTKRARRAFDLARGFTLIELLVVIAIIGVLSTLVLLQLGTARSRSRDAKRIADVNQLRSAIELFYDDNGYYPDSITTTDLADYLTQVPTDPLQSATPYGYVSNEAAAGTDANRTKYQVWTELERKSVGALNGDTDINTTVTPPGWDEAVSMSRSTVDGTLETCADNGDITTIDCVYDLGQP